MAKSRPSTITHLHAQPPAGLFDPENPPEELRYFILYTADTPGSVGVNRFFVDEGRMKVNMTENPDSTGLRHFLLKENKMQGKILARLSFTHCWEYLLTWDGNSGVYRDHVSSTMYALKLPEES